MGIFSGTQGQLTPQSVVGSGQILKFLRILMHIIIICKYEKDRMKNSQEKVVTVFAIITLSVTMETSGLIWPNFELIQALMYVIITCKYEQDPIKRNREKVATPFFKIKTLSVAMETSGPIWPNFELIQAFMHVLIACKYENDQMKNS